jgi:hypothetical protein
VNDPDPPVYVAQFGDLSLYWTFDGFTGCGSVRDVRAIVYDADGILYDDSVYSCVFEGASYTDVIEGNWTVELYGLDGGGRVIYESTSRRVLVIGNADNQFTIDLGAAF